MARTELVRAMPIRIRDQARSPSAGELQQVMRSPSLRKIGVCRHVAQTPMVVGTSGSAAYHWARLMAGLGRLGYYALGKAGVQQLVYVNDLLFLTNDSKGIGQIVLLIFLYAVLGLPFTWKKFRGGVELTWVGFEIALKGGTLGLSISRAQWLVKWLRTTADC